MGAQLTQARRLAALFGTMVGVGLLAAAFNFAGGSTFRSPVSGVLYIVYAVLAGLTAAGLCRTRRQAVHYFESLVVVCIALNIWSALGPFRGAPIGGFAVLGALTVLFAWALRRSIVQLTTA